MKKITLVVLILALIALDNELNAWWPTGVPSMPYPGQQGVPYSMPPVPIPASPQYAVPYPGMPYSIPSQGAPYPYAGMQMPAPPPPPQYSGVPYMPAFVAPYANNAGQEVYNAAVPEYSQLTNEAESKVNGYIGEEEQAISGKASVAKDSVSNEAKKRVAAEEQSISGKASAAKDSVSNEVSSRIAGGEKAVSDTAKNSFDSAMSKFKGIIKF